MPNCTLIARRGDVEAWEFGNAEDFLEPSPEWPMHGEPVATLVCYLQAGRCTRWPGDELLTSQPPPDRSSPEFAARRPERGPNRNCYLLLVREGQYNLVPAPVEASISNVMRDRQPVHHVRAGMPPVLPGRHSHLPPPGFALAVPSWLQALCVYKVPRRPLPYQVILAGVTTWPTTRRRSIALSVGDRDSPLGAASSGTDRARLLGPELPAVLA